jgi:hypothetical protein
MLWLFNDVVSTADVIWGGIDEKMIKNEKYVGVWNEAAMAYYSVDIPRTEWGKP